MKNVFVIYLHIVNSLYLNLFSPGFLIRFLSSNEMPFRSSKGSLLISLRVETILNLNLVAVHYVIYFLFISQRFLLEKNISLRTASLIGKEVFFCHTSFLVIISLNILVKEESAGEEEKLKKFPRNFLNARISLKCQRYS